MTLIDTIVSLQRALDRLRGARERLEGIPDWMRELHEEHSGRKAEIAELEDTVEQARLERRTAESEIAEHQERLKKYQQQINEVQSQREYGALLQEIDTVKSEIQTAEERGFAAMEARDEAEKSLEQAREDFQELDERYARELEKWEAEKPAVREEAEALERRVAELRKQIPRPYAALFDRLSDRYQGQALAAVRIVQRAGKGPTVYHCSACNYRVRPQAVVEIRKGEHLAQCDACKRILYVEDEAQEALA